LRIKSINLSQTQREIVAERVQVELLAKEHRLKLRADAEKKVERQAKALEEAKEKASETTPYATIKFQTHTGVLKLPQLKAPWPKFEISQKNTHPPPDSAQSAGQFWAFWQNWVVKTKPTICSKYIVKHKPKFRKSQKNTPSPARFRSSKSQKKIPRSPVSGGGGNTPYRLNSNKIVHTNVTDLNNEALRISQRPKSYRQTELNTIFQLMKLVLIVVFLFSQKSSVNRCVENMIVE
jgi:hypothetical protein